MQCRLMSDTTCTCYSGNNMPHPLHLEDFLAVLPLFCLSCEGCVAWVGTLTPMGQLFASALHAVGSRVAGGWT